MKFGQIKVKRIITNIHTNDIEAAQLFYGEILGLEVLMDQGWIRTYGNEVMNRVQISFAHHGGSATSTPDFSIEVNDVDAVFKLMKDAGFHIQYGLINEPWGVRRFYVIDPFGKLVNILTHL